MRRKTSLSLSEQTRAVVKEEAKRQRRSMSSLVEIWIEDELVPQLIKTNGNGNGKAPTKTARRKLANA